MKKFFILGLVLFWAAPALAQNFQRGPEAGRPGERGADQTLGQAVDQPEGQLGSRPGTPRGPRRHNPGSTAPIPEDGDEITTTEVSPYANTDFAPWENHLNVDAPVISIE